MRKRGWSQKLHARKNDGAQRLGLTSGSGSPNTLSSSRKLEAARNFLAVALEVERK